MQGRGRFQATAAIALAAVALAGCGSDGSGAGSASESSSKATQQTLTEHQYRELEPIYRAQLPRPGEGDVSTASIQRTIRSCREVDTRDPLVAATVNGCQELLEASRSLIDSDCASVDECTALIADATALLDRAIATVEESRPVIERHVASQDCRDVLLGEEQLAALEKTADVFRRFVDAVESGDPERVTTAGKKVQRTTALDEAPSEREMLRRFQRDCKPTAG